MKIKLSTTKFYLVTADLPKYQKRLDIVLPWLKKNNIEPEIVLGAQTPRGGWYGFFQAINKEISKEEFRPFVILEDDVNFFEYRDELEFPDSADAVWLGNSMSMIRYKKHDDQLSQIFGMGSTHAILFVTKNFCLAFRQGLEIAGKFNLYYDIPTKICQEMFEVYTFNTPIFYQDQKLEGQEQETKFVLAGSRITDDEFEKWKLYRRITLDPIECFVNFPGIRYLKSDHTQL